MTFDFKPRYWRIPILFYTALFGLLVLTFQNCGGSQQISDSNTKSGSRILVLEDLSAQVSDVLVKAGDQAQFVVEINFPVSYDVEFTYSTVDGSAVDGLHYQATMGKAFIPAGETQTTISVTTLADANQETSNSDFYLQIEFFDPALNIDLQPGQAVFVEQTPIPPIPVPPVPVPPVPVPPVPVPPVPVPPVPVPPIPVPPIPVPPVPNLFGNGVAGAACTSFLDCQSGLCAQKICLGKKAQYQAVQGNPGGTGWMDSYSRNGQCYCDSTFDHKIGEIIVSTPAGNKTVLQICSELGNPGRQNGDPIYNDIQCGNGPANDAGDEDWCPGRVDQGQAGCHTIGPKWNLNNLKK